MLVAFIRLVIFSVCVCIKCIEVNIIFSVQRGPCDLKQEK